MFDLYGGGQREPKIMEEYSRLKSTIAKIDKDNTSDIYLLDCYNQRVYTDVSITVKARINDSNTFIMENQNYRIRKLTPRECFRLMGVTEENIDKIQAAGISNAQQYKMAGNSIVVDVLYHIFRKMFVDKESDNAELTLF